MADIYFAFVSVGKVLVTLSGVIRDEQAANNVMNKMASLSLNILFILSIYFFVGNSRFKLKNVKYHNVYV